MKWQLVEADVRGGGEIARQAERLSAEEAKASALTY